MDAEPSVTVTVEETSVVHDDHGNVLAGSDAETRIAQSGGAVESYEMHVRPPRYPPTVRLTG